MKKLSKYILAASLAIGLSSAAFGQSYVTSQAAQSKMTPSSALAALKAGNKRFLSSNTRHFNFLKDAKMSAAEGQFPIAFVLNCVDSRVDSHLVFDQGLANIFTGSVAGNVIDPFMLASMEFATKAAGSKLIVIMGHTHCGAVGAACTGQAFGHINQLIQAIEPAVKTVKAEQSTGSCSQPAFVNKIAKQNAVDMVNLTLQQSPIIAALQKSGQIEVVAAMQDLATGKVTFFDGKGQTI